jgi:hypothetical protein
MTTALSIVAQGEPAGGAPTQDLVAGGVVAILLTVLVLWLGYAHRTGRIHFVDRIADFAARVSGLPRWAALPAAITGGAQLIAVFGFYWDVAKHIDTGRDPGPFGTAAHYPILIGLGGIALGGLLAIALSTGRDTPSSVRVGRDWPVPLGGMLIFICGLTALSGFPLDDLWHRIFGQDVTLWGPTHILMVAGASLSTLGVWVLLVEAGRVRQPGSGIKYADLMWKLRTTSIAGAFLIGMSALQGEFDYGVPQFQLVYQPILIALAAGVALIAARVKLGRGGALGATAFYLGLYGALSLIIGPIFGLSTLHFPLYIAEALLVELVAWRFPARARPVTFGALSGVLIGTVGLAAEWGWSHVWMPLPWPSSLLPEAAVLGLAAGVAGGVLGGFIGRALSADGRHPIQRVPGWVLPAAVIAAIAVIAWPLPLDAGSPTSATVALTQASGPPHRTVNAIVRLAPRNAADHADWLTVTAWQGGGLVVDRLRRVGEGVYQTTQPIPVYGKWKAMLRMENGRAVDAVPIYLPADPAIPAKAVPATSRFTRPFVRDKKVLQREAVGGSEALAVPAYLALLAIVVAWLVTLGWGLRRLERTAGEPYPDEGLGLRAGLGAVRGEGDERDAPRPTVGVQA